MPTAILVDSVSTGQGVDIALVRTGTASPYIPGHQAGFRLVEDFGGVLLRSALDCEVGIFLSVNDVQLGGTAGGAVVIPSGVAVTNDLAHSIPVTLTSSSNTTPIPVSLANIRVSNTPEQAIPVLFGGTVAPVLGVVTVDNTNAEAIPVLQKPGGSVRGPRQQCGRAGAASGTKGGPCVHGRAGNRSRYAAIPGGRRQ
jgi:hypothetical protein